MLRLSSLTALLVVLCAGAIGLSRLIGSTQPNPIAAWFTNPDGSACDKPCLFGIQPGVTKFYDALKMLSIHPMTKNMQKVMGDNSRHYLSFNSSSFCLDIWSTFSNNVELIRLSPSPCDAVHTHIESIKELTLDQVVITLGDPDGIRLGGKVDAITTIPDSHFFFDGTLIFYTFNKDTCVVSPTIATASIEFFYYDGRDSRTEKWQGFARRNLYALRENQNDCGD